MAELFDNILEFVEAICMLLCPLFTAISLGVIIGGFLMDSEPILRKGMILILTGLLLAAIPVATHVLSELLFVWRMNNIRKRKSK